MKKNILVTGASRGIGYAIAKKLSNQADKLILVARTEKSLQKLKKEFPKALNFQIDLGEEKEIEKMLIEIEEKVKGLDVLVNNAGSYFSESFKDTKSSEFDKLYAVHMRAPFLLINKLLPLLKKSKSPIVVNISSASSFARFRTESIYASVKSGLTALTDVLREELQNYNIRFTTIHPYGVNTWNASNPEDLLRTEDIAELIGFIINAHPNCQIQRVDLSNTKQWRQGTPPWIKD